jgi:hypothetical protein
VEEVGEDLTDLRAALLDTDLKKVRGHTYR